MPQTKENKTGTDKQAQWVEVLVAKPDGLSLILGTHVEGEKGFPHIVL